MVCGFRGRFRLHFVNTITICLFLPIPWPDPMEEQRWLSDRTVKR